MAKTGAKRNVGTEILEGLRQLKRGEIGRVITVPAVADIRERTGRCSAYPCGRSKNGNKAAALHQALHALFS